MKSCKNCGKLSFILSKDGLCKKCSKEIEERKRQSEHKQNIYEEYLKKNPLYAQDQKYLQEQGELLSEVLAARNKYKVDHDIQSAITVYEHALLHSDPPLRSNAHTMFLSNLYIQAKEYDKAWSYLNGLLLKNQDLTYEIRKDQCRILKKEKRYVDAMLMLILSFLADSKWKNIFNYESFVKEATPIANKLGWTQEAVERFADCIKKRVDSRDYDEASMVNEFREILIDLDGSRQ